MRISQRLGRYENQYTDREHTGIITAGKENTDAKL